MKRGTLTLAVGLLLGMAMFFCAQTFMQPSGKVPMEAGSLLPEVQWLGTWLKLDADQLQKVTALHVAYLPECEKLCHRVYDSNARLLAEGAKHTTLDGPLRDAIAERSRLNEECQEALLQHVFATAQCMRPEQARQYLDLMIPSTFGIPAAAAAAAEGTSRRHHR